MVAQLRISVTAERDIETILIDSLREHGPAARDRYAALIEAAIKEILTAPDGVGARLRPETGKNAYSWSLANSKNHTPIIADRVKDPAHTIYYRYNASRNQVTIRRILHQRTAPQHYLN